MAIKLPEKNFHTISELRKKWECTDDDIRHLIVTEKIKPSYFIRGQSGHTVTFEYDDVLDAMAETAEYQFSDEIGPNISGYFYLREPIQVRPLDCKFYLFSSTPDTLKTQDSDGYWCRLDTAVALAEVMEFGVVMNTEVAKFEAGSGLDLTEPLATKERNTLLVIIAVLADQAKISLGDYRKPGKAAGYISGLSSEFGTYVSKRAIEDHLKNIPKALGTRMK